MRLVRRVRRLETVLFGSCETHAGGVVTSGKQAPVEPHLNLLGQL